MAAVGVWDGQPSMVDGRPEMIAGILPMADARSRTRGPCRACARPGATIAVRQRRCSRRAHVRMARPCGPVRRWSLRSRSPACAARRWHRVSDRRCRPRCVGSVPRAGCSEAPDGEHDRAVGAGLRPDGRSGRRRVSCSRPRTHLAKRRATCGLAPSGASRSTFPPTFSSACACHRGALAIRAVDLLHDAAGMNSVMMPSALERAWRDVHTASQHVVLGVARLEVGGRVLLGLDPGSPVI